MAEEHGDTPPPASTPSFTGHLDLKSFEFQDTMRRSPRLLTPAVSAPATPTPAAPKSRSPLKRKATDTPDGSPSPSLASSTTKKPKRRPKSGYAPPSTYAHLSLLPDRIGPNLLIQFVGLNPGLQTASSGHAYAHPSNLFWKLLASTGITPTPDGKPLSPTEDVTLPERYRLGLTNIVSRPSRNGAELKLAELDEGVEVLEGKIRRWRPESVCIVGKSIWESIWRVRRGRKMRKEEFRYGWQESSENMGVVKGEGEDGGWKGARVFVATSTSGLAATMKPDEKKAVWQELGDWVTERRKEGLNGSSGVEGMSEVDSR